MTTVKSVFALLSTATLLAAANPPGSAPAVNWDEVAQNAALVKSHMREVSRMLRAKTFDVSAVRERAEQSQEAVRTLNGLLEMEPAPVSDWEAIQTRVKLLSIFQDQKMQLLASADPVRERSRLRAMAEGVAIRAEKVEEAARHVTEPGGSKGRRR